ncbi:MAG TPA: hypothetical protein PLJ27_14520 [Polyangiaceae bacterium]|nr:hypothetical protein [Polyangiaceae bacterium]
MKSKLLSSTLGGLFALMLFVGCSAESDDGSAKPGQTGFSRPPACYGKCDGPSAGTFLSPYEADLEALHRTYGGAPLKSVEQAFSVQMDLGEVSFTAPTHLFGGPVNIIPYADEDALSDAAGRFFPHRDEIIAKVFPPGSVGFAIKHHRPSHRTISLGGSAASMKENMKLQDTHIGIVVGIEWNGQPGAITINNPQSYQQGLFGDDDYPMIFVRPVFPGYVSSQLQSAFMDNIRTMMVGFNTVSNFPGDYNGGDPLAANSPEKLQTHVEMMVRAIAGDAAAEQFFRRPENLIYCAELAFVATSAGLLFPLNDTTMIPLVGQQVWDTFQSELHKHNAHERSAFTEQNENELVSSVTLSIAPADLQPIAEYAPANMIEAERQKLAFKPMTMADIVQHFMRTHVPREQMGESLAPVQGQLLGLMRPGLLEAMGMDRLPSSDPRRQAVDALFDNMVQVVSTPYGSYAEFQQAIAPLMDQARAMTGPRDDSGTGLFVPPSLFHVVTQGKHNGGLLQLAYEGHGLHVTQVKLKANPSQPPATPEPVVEPNEPFAGSRVGSCGGVSPDVSCACDDLCVQLGDCCEDYDQHCQ